MLINSKQPMHLTYCLNVHPGQSWQENLLAIKNHALIVRDLICPQEKFGLGLRLSNDASLSLSEPAMLAEFRRFLDDHGLYVFTINGFPYGEFHGKGVKSNVYLPDWRDPKRRDYTVRLGHILASLLDEGVEGTISTVPGSYGPWIKSDRDVRAMAEMITSVAREFAKIEQDTNRTVHLAIEPEPDCYIETTQQFIDFFDGPLMDCGDNSVLRHVGMCLDTAHAAVAFENPLESLKLLADRVKKIQLSSALSVSPSPEAIEQLRPFCEDVYLHQVKGRCSDGTIISYQDLPDAIESYQHGHQVEQWRIHFHVPLFFNGSGLLKSTNHLLTPDLISQLAQTTSPGHLEIETYTFNVLPETLRPTDLVEGIAEEFRWVKANLLI